MVRNLKGLGLAFIALLAMSAIGASTAEATPQFTCSTYPCTATGTAPLRDSEYTTPAGSVKCATHYKVEKYNAITEDFSAATSTVTVTVTTTNCQAFGFLSATVNMNGCDYDWHATQRLAEHHYLHHVDITCPAGKAIVVTAGSCEATIGAQVGLTDITTMNLANGSLTVEPTVGEMTMNVVKDGFGCPFSGTGHTKASYHGHVTLTRVGGGTFWVSGS
jgi:hypothetical protein